MKKIVAVLTFLVMLIFLLACGDASDAQTDAPTPDHLATAQAILSATATPTPTFVHQVTDIVTHHHSDDDFSRLHGVITGAACDSAGICHVDVTENTPLADIVQQDAYVVLDALYASSIHPTQVTVNTFGQVTDKYGNSKTGMWAIAVLTKQTEAKFNWKGLDYASAWAVYDQAAYLVNGLK